MPFQFKLAKRLALAHLVAAAALSACSGEEGGILGPAINTQLVVSPGNLTLDSRQSVQFVAYSAEHDSPAVTVSWAATGGSITPAGVYTATVPGNFEVTATDRAGHRGSARVRVAEDGTTVVETGAAECAKRRPEWIWCDDFEQDRLGSYFEYDNSGGNFTRAPGVGVKGSSGMRAHWLPGVLGAGSLHLGFGRTPSASFRPVDGGTRDYRDIYWRMYVKQQAGWVGGGPVKLSRAFVFTSASYTQAAIGHVWNGTTSPDNQYLIIDPVSGTDAAGHVRTTVYNDFAHFNWLGSARGALPMFDASHAGQWFCVEVHMRLNNRGAADGLMEMMINGVPQARRDGLNFLGSYADFGINAVYVENYWNGGAVAAQDRYIDNFVVSTAPIGCPS